MDFEDLWNKYSLYCVVILSLILPWLYATYHTGYFPEISILSIVSMLIPAVIVFIVLVVIYSIVDRILKELFWGFEGKPYKDFGNFLLKVPFDWEDNEWTSRSESSDLTVDGSNITIYEFTDQTEVKRELGREQVWGTQFHGEQKVTYEELQGTEHFLIFHIPFPSKEDKISKEKDIKEYIKNRYPSGEKTKIYSDVDDNSYFIGVAYLDAISSYSGKVIFLSERNLPNEEDFAIKNKLDFGNFTMEIPSTYTFDTKPTYFKRNHSHWEDYSKKLSIDYLEFVQEDNATLINTFYSGAKLVSNENDKITYKKKKEWIMTKSNNNTKVLIKGEDKPSIEVMVNNIYFKP